MQQRILKRIPATVVTRIDFDDPRLVLAPTERAALVEVAAKHSDQITLRKIGLNQMQIRQLEFFRWMLESDSGR